MSENLVPDVKREKIVIPDEMTVSEIQKKYSLKRPAALRAKKNLTS
jgi:hypothetical protein